MSTLTCKLVTALLACLLSVIASTGGEAVCQEGWLRFEDKCYYISDPAVDSGSAYTEINTACRDKGGRVLSIKTREENQFLKDNLIGGQYRMLSLKCVKRCNQASRSDRMMDYQWWDGRKYPDGDYNFGTGQPVRNGNGVAKYCNVMQPDGKWYSAACGTRYQYFCEADPQVPDMENSTMTSLVENIEETKTCLAECKDTGPFPPEFEETVCPCGWTPDEKNETCYISLKSKMSYRKASSECKKRGGDLLSIESSSENILAKELTGGKMHWIGMRCQKNCNDKRRPSRRRKYIWEDKTPNNFPKSYSNWNRNKPTRGKLCAVMLTNGKWGSAPCYKKYQPVCKKDVLADGGCKPYPADTCANRYFAKAYMQKMEMAYIKCAGSMCMNENHTLVGDKCYSMTAEGLSFADARAECKKNKGDLAVLATKAESDEVSSGFLNGAKATWIGLECKTNCDNGYRWARRNSYKWVDGTEYDKTEHVWEASSPLKTAKCGALMNGEWVGKPCEEKMIGVCQYESTPVASEEDFETEETNDYCPDVGDLQTRLDILKESLECGDVPPEGEAP